MKTYSGDFPTLVSAAPTGKALWVPTSEFTVGRCEVGPAFLTRSAGDADVAGVGTTL